MAEPSSLVILVAGPYRSGTGDDPERMARNLREMEACALPLFRAGHVPIVGEWIALPLVALAGSRLVGDAAFDEIFHPIAERLLARCDAVLRVGGASQGADRMLSAARERGLRVFRSLAEVPGCSGVAPEAPRTNALGQPIGAALVGWMPRPRPPRTPLEGRLCRLEALDAAKHAAPLHAAHELDREGRNWTYLPYGPFASAAEYRAWIESVQGRDDPLFYAVVDTSSGRAVGVASYLRIEPAMGTIEIGHLAWSPALQRSAAATEAMFLMLRRAFDELGYRRTEWKCDRLNAPSMRAAERLGFRFEGVFRQAVVTKGRNRDSAWFSILDGEWPAVRRALEAWLDPANFDGAGRQRRRLAELRAEARQAG